MQSYYQYPQVMPTPHFITYKSGSMVLKKVYIKHESSSIDDANYRYLKKILSNKQVMISDKAGDDTIILNLTQGLIMDIPQLKAKGLPELAQMKDEGYRLVIDSGSGTIWLDAKDSVGLFYAIRSFEQLFLSKDSSTLVDAIIVDEPHFSLRGIVEGFYGTPWSHQERLDQIRFYGRYKLNAYIYAPKDDPYHRKYWREPYPLEEITRMQELIDVAKEERVEFIFAISPGIDVRFDGEDGEQDFVALITKMESLYQLGVRSFAIFFDDIDNRDGDKQANFLNRFKKEFIDVKQDLKPLITVPVEYDTSVMFDEDGNIKKYTSGFAKNLDSDILLLWTGRSVVPPSLDQENVAKVKSIYQNKLGLWWNYPVSDYYQNKLALGPIYDLAHDLHRTTEALFINPMEHAQLSKIAILTGADYAWNSKDYQDEHSLHQSIQLLYEGDLAQAMEIFANHSSHMKFTWAECGRADAPIINALIKEFWSKWQNKIDYSTEAKRLHTLFNEVKDASHYILQHLSKEELIHCEENVVKLGLLAEKSIMALEMLTISGEEHSSKQIEIAQILKDNLVTLKEGKQLSEALLLAFIEDSINSINIVK